MTDLEQRVGQLIIEEYESAPDQSTYFSGSTAEGIAEQYNLSRDLVARVMAQVQAEYDAIEGDAPDEGSAAQWR